MENNHINYYGTLFILPSDMKIPVIYQKWIIMNFVWLLKIVIFVLQMYIVVGVKLLEDVCLEINNMQFVPLLVSMDGSMMLKVVLEKYTLVCFLMLLPKLLDLLPLKKLNQNNTLELYYIIKL